MRKVRYALQISVQEHFRKCVQEKFARAKVFDITIILIVHHIPTFFRKSICNKEENFAVSNDDTIHGLPRTGGPWGKRLIARWNVLFVRPLLEGL